MMLKDLSPLLIRALCIGLPLAATGGTSDAAAESLVLVENGQSHAPIVVFEDAPPLTRQAAEELAEYIERTSGARPEVIEGRPDPLPERAIWVGYQDVLEELFPDTDLGFDRPEEILIAANDSHLVIAGRDRWDPDNLLVDFGRRATVDGVQQEYGTANAVYTFLQDYLGVRWLWPGETGVDVLDQPTIAFDPFEYRYSPQIRARSGLFRFAALDDNRAPHGGRWARYQRLQLDSLVVPGGHGFTDWWERFGGTHPEYFALQPDGTRGGGEEAWPNPRTVKMCHSNPALWDQWMADVERDLEQNPNQTVFDAEPNDSWSRGHCVCELCSEWDHPEAPVFRFSWKGQGGEHVALSDRHITFANTLARMLKERYPDQDYFVRIGAYGVWRPAPVGVTPDDNVIVSAVFNFHNRPSMDGRISMDHRELFLDWGGVAPNLVWRPNLGGGAGWQIGLPNVATRHAIGDMRLAAENNVIGLWFDTIWEHWANQGPHYYMLGQMAWNPYADGDAILDDYYRRAFGEAHEEMKAYWTLIEGSAEEIVFNDKPQAEAWDDVFFTSAYGFLDEAAQAVEGEPEIYADRLAFVRSGLDYTRLILENRELIARLRESQGEDAEAETAARANWEEIIEINEAHPAALNWSYVGPGRSRTSSVHPDYYQP